MSYWELRKDLDPVLYKAEWVQISDREARDAVAARYEDNCIEKIMQHMKKDEKFICNCLSSYVKYQKDSEYVEAWDASQCIICKGFYRTDIEANRCCLNKKKPRI